MVWGILEASLLPTVVTRWNLIRFERIELVELRLFFFLQFSIRGVINSWFRSYLTDRKQTTEVNNVVFEAETTLCGVPEGSVLGPLLFLLYINDIYKSSSLFAFYQFADDTSIILANNNLKELEKLINRELGNVNEWLKANKLFLNIKKIKFCNLVISPAKEYALHT